MCCEVAPLPSRACIQARLATRSDACHSGQYATQANRGVPQPDAISLHQTLQTCKHFARWGGGRPLHAAAANRTHHHPDSLVRIICQTPQRQRRARQSHVASHEERSTYMHYESTTCDHARRTKPDLLACWTLSRVYRRSWLAVLEPCTVRPVRCSWHSAPRTADAQCEPGHGSPI